MTVTNMDIVLRNDSSGFFAPVDASLLGALFTTYRLTRANIERMGQFMASDDCRIAMRYYLDACKDDQGRCGLHVDKLLVCLLMVAFWLPSCHLALAENSPCQDIRLSGLVFTMTAFLERASALQ